MTIVYSYYVADILHRGHLIYMRNAKKLAGKDGFSIVGILTDKAVMERKKKPVFSLDERMELAEAVKYNDIVIPQADYSPLNNVKNIHPDIMLESASHTEVDIKKARDLMRRIGGVVFVMPYYPVISSTEIKEKIITIKGEGIQFGVEQAMWKALQRVKEKFKA